MRIATHNGSFHADDTFAIAALLMLWPGAHVIRTRDQQVMASCDLRVDVGLGNDPDTGDFDHHQKGGAGQRPNGIRYASFGLVWKQFGARITGCELAAGKVDEKLVQIIDGHDNGQTLFDARFDKVACKSVDHVVSLLNPLWDEQPGPDDYDAAFDEAVMLAQTILRREIARALGQIKAAARIREAIAQAEDPRLVELDSFMPWREVLVDEAPAALLVVFPNTSGWAVQAVPQRLDAFANRIDLPKEWAGKTDADLEAVSGVQGAAFCHTGRFFAAARTRQAALALARKALA